MSTSNLLRALAHRNFRLYFFGQGVSLIGTWMQQVAMAWLVYEITQSKSWLGIVGFAGQIPTFFVAPFAGVLVDRWNRHRLLLVTQTLAMLQAFVLAALALTGVIEVWHVVVLGVFLGLITAFDMPARQAFLTEMVTRKEDLANAIALNSTIVNGARLFGPPLAGLVLAWTNAGFCFLVNALSFLAVLAALVAMRVTPRERAGAGRLLEGLREGFAYAFGFPPVRALLLLLGLVSLCGMSYSTLLPAYTQDVLHGDSATMGLLAAAAGIGALAAGLLLASRNTVPGLGRWILLAPVGLGFALVAFSFITDLWLALVLLAVTGFTLMSHMAASNTVIQTIVDERMRGRVMSFYSMAFMGAAPLGSLLTGTLAEEIGMSHTLQISGLFCLVGAAAFATQFGKLRAHIRPLYVRLGLLPPLVTDPPAAEEAALAPAQAVAEEDEAEAAEAASS